MSASCEACKTVELWENNCDRHREYLKELVRVQEKMWAVRDSWFRRLLAGVSLSEAISLVDAAADAVRAQQVALAAAEVELERAEDRVPGSAADKAAKAIAADIEKDLFAETDREFLGSPNIKGLAEKLDADLKFEDRVKEAKLGDLPGVKDTVLAAPKGRCPCGGYDTNCTIPKQDHSVHQGTHYVGDNCPGKHETIAKSTREELKDLYLQLPTPELKDHVEAALDAAVERGIQKPTKKFHTKTKR